MYVLYMSGPIVRYDIQHFSDVNSRCFYQIANKKSIQVMSNTSYQINVGEYKSTISASKMKWSRSKVAENGNTLVKNKYLNRLLESLLADEDHVIC